jgi:hypothetical protein
VEVNKMKDKENNSMVENRRIREIFFEFVIKVKSQILYDCL